mgnify:CR=1 FL=1
MSKNKLWIHFFRRFGLIEKVFPGLAGGPGLISYGYTFSGVLDLLERFFLASRREARDLLVMDTLFEAFWTHPSPICRPPLQDCLYIFPVYIHIDKNIGKLIGI